MTYLNENFPSSFPSDQPENLDNSSQIDHSDLQGHGTPLQKEAIREHAKPWKNEMDALRRDGWALHSDVQDMDWLFCSNNPLSLEVAAVSLPFEFNVPKEMFEGRRNPRAHLMQYNDYINVLGASDVAKCKAFSTTLRGSMKD
ncbi:hypothetical protein J1N35_025409 [Gossypium stocksii]|uniref:Uncharacterized protein n=1 Tax=Gossypium stocksii TaxID=47602 RepID=A0A9D3ZXM5_9ROSI|nr:hypothetical protein J1N35_025409 [Gossypium stocksii]